MAERNPKARHTAEPPPADFLQFAPVEKNVVLAKRYDRGINTIARWRAETGTAGRSGFDRTTPVVADTVPRAPRPWFPAETLHYAAQKLRKQGRIGNVFRCDIRLAEQSAHTWGDAYNWRHRNDEGFQPLPDHGAGHYMVDGYGVLSAAQLLELADRV